MKKMFLLVLSVLLLCSCTENRMHRTVKIEIPVHPWERKSDRKLWYSLEWTDGTELKRLHIDEKTRVAEIPVAAGQTVYVCAYPLGEMLAFGTAVTPLFSSSTAVLDQNGGVLADLLINIDREASSQVNFDRLFAEASAKTEDFRFLDMSQIAVDVNNGALKKSSLKTIGGYDIEPFEVVRGQWVSEFALSGSFIASEGTTPPMTLPPGVFRWYNPEKNMELRIVVGDNGDIFHYERTSLIPQT